MLRHSRRRVKEREELWFWKRDLLARKRDDGCPRRAHDALRTKPGSGRLALPDFSWAPMRGATAGGPHLTGCT